MRIQFVICPFVKGLVPFYNIVFLVLKSKFNNFIKSIVINTYLSNINILFVYFSPCSLFLHFLLEIKDKTEISIIKLDEKHK